MFMDPSLIYADNPNISEKSIVKMTDTATEQWIKLPNGELTPVGGDCQNKVRKWKIYFVVMWSRYIIYMHF